MGGLRKNQSLELHQAVFPCSVNLRTYLSVALHPELTLPLTPPPMYARRMVDRITQRSQQISTQPFSGRKVPEYESEDIRELIEKPYRIIYRLKQDQIDVERQRNPALEE
jgi:Txe/YoeB family toxin of Txe-Axe toxin-antitoxin module